MFLITEILSAEVDFTVAVFWAIYLSAIFGSCFEVFEQKLRLFFFGSKPYKWGYKLKS